MIWLASCITIRVSQGWAVDFPNGYRGYVHTTTTLPIKDNSSSFNCILFIDKIKQYDILISNSKATKPLFIDVTNWHYYCTKAIKLNRIEVVLFHPNLAHCHRRLWHVTCRDRNKNDLKPTYSIHGCYRLITCFIAEDAFHYHLEHKRFKDEYKGNSTNETHGTPFELSWVSSLPVKPYNASNFTWGLVGFWNETRAAERGFSRNGSSKEYFM